MKLVTKVERDNRGQWIVWFKGKKELQTFDRRWQARAHLSFLRAALGRTEPLETPPAAA